jgi:microcystin-dependent protein
MSEPFIGEIRLMPWNYPPRGWMLCDGATLSIAQNQALFALLGTAYGGDGVQSFKLPDLRSRAAMGYGPGVALGQQMGEPMHTLLTTEVPPHTHTLTAAAANGTLDTVADGQWLGGIADGKGGFGYAPPPAPGPALTTMQAASISPSGLGQAHENRQPYLCVSYAIAVSGIFPSRN